MREEGNVGDLIKREGKKGGRDRGGGGVEIRTDKG